MELRWTTVLIGNQDIYFRANRDWLYFSESFEFNADVSQQPLLPNLVTGGGLVAWWRLGGWVEAWWLGGGLVAGWRLGDLVGAWWLPKTLRGTSRFLGFAQLEGRAQCAPELKHIAGMRR